MSDHTPSTPPGWYHATGDPAGTQRYWDGELWQGEPQPVASPDPAMAGQGGYVAVGSRPEYATWGNRALANIIDGLLVITVFIAVSILGAIGAAISEGLGLLIWGLLGLVALLGILYLLYWVPGITGQSPGRRVMGYKVVKESNGAPIGGGAFIGRQIVGSVINNLCYIDALWPLWDDKNQRLADKVVSSVAVTTPKTGMFPIFPNGKPF